MKKIITIILACIMIFAFSACGEVDTSPITDEEIGNLYAAPNDFKGRTFEFTGRVLDVEKDGDEYAIQAYYDKTNYDKNTVIYYTGEFSAKDDEYIRVKGSIGGEFKGENMMGGEVTAPIVNAESVEKIDAIEAYPAKKTVKVDKTIEKGNCAVTISKVDYTDTELRIYVVIKNNGSSNVDIYPDQGVVIQDGKQFDCSYNYEYDGPSSEVRSGVKTDGVITFEKVKMEDFRYTFDGYDNDLNEMTFSFKIDVE